MSKKSKVRHDIEKLPGVVSTWMEWEHADGRAKKILIVEVDFDTDPNAGQRGAIETIFDQAAKKMTTMIIDGCRVLPSRK